MALPNKENNTSVESGNIPPTHNIITTTYANIAKKSFNNDNITERVQHSKLWITSRTKGALLFDVSSLSDSLSHQWFMKEIKNQTDAVFGIRFQKRNKTRYTEVYTKKASTHNLKTEGLTFITATAKHKIIPCLALDDDSIIVRVSLSRLPMEEEDELTEGIHQSLQPFGEVLNVQLYKENITGYFMGTGLVTLKVDNTDPSKNFNPLTHVIHYKNSGEIFYTVWADMPTWRRFCHEEGHTKYQCKKSLASMICYNCHEMGYRAASCTQKDFKRQRKTPLSKEDSTMSGPRRDGSTHQPRGQYTFEKNKIEDGKENENENENNKDNKNDNKNEKNENKKENKDVLYLPHNNNIR